MTEDKQPFDPATPWTPGRPEREPTPPPAGPDLTEESIRALLQQRFRQRVARVLETMRRERIDWRALAFITPDGRIALRVIPIEMSPEEQ